MDRDILHCDLNSFFASVACRDNPSLCDYPVAVCGEKELRHGIILAKNELAKSFGVKTAEPIWQALKKCPNLVTVKPDYTRYAYFSKLVRSIYEQYSNFVEPFGIDECWIDVTGSHVMFGSPQNIAERIRKRVKTETGLTVSVGVSFNKVFAKLGSDLKKPDAVTVISRDNFKEKVWPLPVQSMIGIGSSAAKKLCDLGIFTLGDLANSSKDALLRKLGKQGVVLQKFALGEDTSEVKPIEYHHVPKSVSRSVTLPHDITETSDVHKIFLKLSEEIAHELKAEGLYAKGVQIHLKDNSLNVNELQTTLDFPTRVANYLADCGASLFDRSYNFAKPLRAVGIKAINLIPDNAATYQLNLFGNTNQRKKLETLQDETEKLRNRFGKNAVTRAGLLNFDVDPHNPFGRNK